MKRNVASVLITLLFASVAVMAADQTVYKGKLNPGLGLASPYFMTLKIASAETIANLPKVPAEGDEVLAGRLAGLPVVLAIPKKDDKYFYLDVNQNGKFEPSERFSFPEKGNLEIKLPPVGIFTSIPMKLSYHETQSHTKVGEILRGITYEIASTATGVVDIGGEKTLVQYVMNLRTKNIDFLTGVLGVDCNRDGQIEKGNVETYRAVRPTGQPVVFRVGKHYVATKSVDINTGEIVMEAHPASDYKRIEMLIGGAVPDFSFKDLDGKTHQLAEFRGKYLLLDFWGTW